MFCLRSWIPLLVFLTNASPIYVILFLSANYILQRPCVYCSILLFVLVFSLFDFHADWFEPRWQTSSPTLTETASSLLSGNATFAEALSETASLAISAINGTGGSLASAALGTARNRVLGGGAGGENYTGTATVGGFEWLRNLIDKRQFRIPCVDVLVRL